MSQILNKVYNVDGSDSEAVKEALGGFFQNIFKYKEIETNQWLRALENVINRFPKFCGTHRPIIESYLSYFLSSNNFYNVIEAAKCAHAVQQVRPAQEKAATAKSCWRDQMITLCDAAHKLIDALFPKSVGMFSDRRNRSDTTTSAPSLQDALSDIDRLAGDQESAVNKTTILCTRLTNVMIFMQAMLVEIYPVAKPIQPQLILEVILQALSASGSEDSHNVTTIKTQALRTLDALVACLGSNLIPFSALVFRFVMQTLKWSSEKPSDETRKVRIAAYGSLTQWLDCLHVHRPMSSGRTRAWHDELTTHILGDVTPTQRVMQLTVNAQPMKNLSKKARKRLANTMLMESGIASHMPGEKNKSNLSDKSNDEVAVAALECAETFLFVCGIFLKNTTHRQFQELLVRECFAITPESARGLPLLRALEACRKSCPSKVPAPTQYCLQLYSVLINTTREISKFCSNALLDIRLHLHCSPPSLNFAIDESTRKKEKEEDRKRVSERNRAALEKLLGNDWMNSPNTGPIVIPDEPARKRSKHDDSVVIDNVSISSESVHSIDSDESITDVVQLLEDDDTVGIHDEPTQGNITRDELDTANNDASVIDTENGLILDKDKESDSTDDKNVDSGLTIDKDNGLTIDNDNESNITVNERDLTIHSKPTQVVANNEKIDESPVNDKVDDTEVEKIMITPNSEANSSPNINDAKTQLPNSERDKSPLSMEVVYDYPNTGKEKVTVLEKMDDENLPSTNETDDIQITCGQVVKNSQDSDKKEEIEISIIVEVPKVNGTDKSLSENETENETNEIAPKDTITVEDMLADFVDEVNETHASTE